MSPSAGFMEFGHKSKFTPHVILRRSNMVLYGGALHGGSVYWPLAITVNSCSARTKERKNCPAVSWVMYACAEGNCNRHRGTTVVHIQAMKAADRRTGRRGNRRGSGPSAGERTRDGWGEGMPDPLQEIESNSLSAKVAETNG